MRKAGVVISGGGTGGHIFPALAVARKLRETVPGLPLTFAGGRRRIEAGILESSGFSFIPMTVEGLKGRGWKSMKGLALLPVSFFQALALLARARPRLVIGVGGYSSGPVVLLASIFRIPTLILEQNVRPGFTNRLRRPLVRKAVVAFEESLAFFKGKGIVLGNPVREEFERLPPAPPAGPFTLLVFGGSQGSHFLNTAVAEALPHLAPEGSRLRVVHQTGERDLERVRGRYRELGFEDAEVSPFFADMPARFARAHLIVCRAGATTCAELIAGRRAAVLVPFAGASEGHQLLNARALEKAGAAVVLEENRCTGETLAETIIGLMRDKNKVAAIAAGLSSLRRERAAEKIARLCLDMLDRSAQEK